LPASLIELTMQNQKLSYYFCIDTCKNLTDIEGASVRKSVRFLQESMQIKPKRKECAILFQKPLKFKS
jgi:hypothetical protein